MLEIAGKRSKNEIIAESTDGLWSESWREILKTAVRDVAELCRRLALPAGIASTVSAAGVDFPLLVPAPYLSRIRPGDPNDPLLLQILPRLDELEPRSGFSLDPVGDLAAQREPGMLCKYQRRALLVLTGACAVHCRYCFRRHFPYSDAPRGLDAWEGALDELQRSTTIDEVILSGGDPWMWVDDQFTEFVRRLNRLDHLRRLRVHTRLPIMIPQRVTASLLATLTNTRLTPFVVVHINHPREIDDDVSRALRLLVDAGIVVLNQAVLLRGVNDAVDPLEELCLRLVQLRVLPYYLHQLDRVQGSAHFEVPRETGQRIVAELLARLPGYAVPRYVVELPGAVSKIPLPLQVEFPE
ncbi:MAG: EF-P beta-lysylation protein EpmB [Planctomycetes bacterium]|nr:EF-P beta-lysylation protein EpmB [Planctomycetota bacterium]